MPAVENVLVVGGGAAGTATAILLAQAGVTVDLVDVKPEPTAIGSGITLQGNALRVLKQLGVWDDVSAAGYPFDSLGLRAPDPAGTLLAEIPDVKTGGPDLPATLGMPRPELARVLLERALSAGAKVRFGTTFTELTQDADGVDVTFADGSTGRYDLVIGADGL
ncbi:MAG TPA: FAD-dependent monooxygenase, partial [Kineosporiaceae bacterium]|nr:FAD-dependent monooxygenase [Kineosporiaceae bacterium]